LFTDALSTVAYTGTATSSLYANPTATSTYVVTATSSNGCTKTASTTVTRLCNTIVNLNALIEGYVDASLSPVVAMRPVAMNQFVAGATATDCDVITVELHNSTAPYAMVATSQANLNVNGLATASFNPAVSAGTYYVVVKHRTTVETWSNPISIPFSSTSSTTVAYDFTSGAGQAYSSNMVDVNGSGKFAFYSGDFDGGAGAGAVETEDYSLWQVDSDNFAAGYISSDLNGDGAAESNDYSIWETNANNFIGAAIPQ
jgi:hypothetical protein